MEPSPKKWKPDPMLQIAVDAGLNGDYRPIAEFMKWEGVINLEEAFKRMLPAFLDAQMEISQLRFMSDELPRQEVFNSEFDPEFDTSAETAGGNSKNKKWPYVLVDHIEEMDDYTFETLQEQLGFMFSTKTCESRRTIATRHKNVKARPI